MRRRTGLAIAGAALLAWGEWLNWRWSRTLVGNSEGATEAVVVLGFRNPQPTANFVTAGGSAPQCVPSPPAVSTTPA